MAFTPEQQEQVLGIVSSYIPVDPLSPFMKRHLRRLKDEAHQLSSLSQDDAKETLRRESFPDAMRILLIAAEQLGLERVIELFLSTGDFQVPKLIRPSMESALIRGDAVAKFLAEMGENIYRDSGVLRRMISPENH